MPEKDKKKKKEDTGSVDYPLEPVNPMHGKWDTFADKSVEQGKKSRQTIQDLIDKMKTKSKEKKTKKGM